MLKLQTIVDICKPAWQIGYDDRILLLGSCFSDEIGRKMEEHNLQVTSNPFGTLYNPLSIAQAMQMTEVPELVAHEGLWHSMAHHGAFSRSTESETREVVAESIATMQKALSEATVVIVTFGTAWVYEYAAFSGQPSAVVGNCHKLPASEFTRRRLSVEEIVAAWQPLIARYPDKHWIFTVSPIRHIKDGLHENQLSKATLLMAVEKLLMGSTNHQPPITNHQSSITNSGEAAYFPSYEILQDELRDYRFYADDLVHPSSLAVNYIWERFTETFCTPQTRNQLNIENKRWKFAHHMPLHLKQIVCILFLAAALIGCANRGVGPQGGPKDSIPPVAVKSTPENGTVDFHDDKIEVLFNEYIQLDNIAQNLLMSPPQQKAPVVKARGKRLMIKFEEPLADSATYTLDFGDAVCDYTEKNPAHGFSFAFSTGPEIDTLEMLGMVVNAEDLNPMQGMSVGIHRNHADSAFVRLPFSRLAKTDSAGHFRIGNIHEGTYRVYGLDDISRDYRLSPGEGMAFLDSLVTPPDSNVVLWLSKEQKSRLYLQRTLRDQQHQIVFLFSATPDSLMTFSSVRGADSTDVNYLVTYSMKGDTVTLWLADSLAITRDTILLETRYRRSDSVYNMEWYADTIRAVWRAPRLTERARAAQERERRNRKLELKSNARKSFELYDTLAIKVPSPISGIDKDSLHLMEKIDSVYKPVSFTLNHTALKIQLIAKLEAGKSYELHVDSGAITDIYGVANHKQKFQLQMKTTEDYSTLRVRVIPNNAPIRVQLLSNKDKILKEQPAGAEGAFFEYLKPDSYYLRLYIDFNGDGKWTPGSWEDHRQPEPVYYYPQKVQTKANWDFEEEWDYTARPQLESKPKELINVTGSKKK